MGRGGRKSRGRSGKESEKEEEEEQQEEDINHKAIRINHKTALITHFQLKTVLNMGSPARWMRH